MIPNAYCKKHDEIEPQDNTGFWVCPRCSRESMKKLCKPNKDGIKPLDAALEKIEQMMRNKK